MLFKCRFSVESRLEREYKEFARILAEELGEPTLFSENIMVQEQLETQQQVQDAEMENEETLFQKQELGI